jgi:hypothetical protein
LSRDSRESLLEKRPLAENSIVACCIVPGALVPISYSCRVWRKLTMAALYSSRTTSLHSCGTFPVKTHAESRTTSTCGHGTMDAVENKRNNACRYEGLNVSKHGTAQATYVGGGRRKGR